MGRCVLLTVLFAAVTHIATAQGNSRLKPEFQPQATEFEGVWRGKEKCRNISAEGASLNVDVDGPSGVVITGLYSTSGNIKANIIDGNISIPRQKIPDPIFLNITIEGNLVISKNHKMLNGIILIWNNDARDECSVSYAK